MSRDLAIRGKLQELAVKIEEEDPRAARVLHELAETMRSNCTRELNQLAENLIRRVVTGPSGPSAQA